MKSIAKLLILLTAMSALGACQTTRVVGNCPVLPPPPKAAIDVLQAQGDTRTDAWVVLLDRHYQKLDACNGK